MRLILSIVALAGLGLTALASAQQGGLSLEELLAKDEYTSDEAYSLSATLRAACAEIDTPYGEGCKSKCGQVARQIQSGRGWGGDRLKNLLNNCKDNYATTQSETSSSSEPEAESGALSDATATGSAPPEQPAYSVPDFSDLGAIQPLIPATAPSPEVSARANEWFAEQKSTRGENDVTNKSCMEENRVSFFQQQYEKKVGDFMSNASNWSRTGGADYVAAVSTLGMTEAMQNPSMTDYVELCRRYDASGDTSVKNVRVLFNGCRIVSELELSSFSPGQLLIRENQNACLDRSYLAETKYSDCTGQSARRLEGVDDVPAFCECVARKYASAFELGGPNYDSNTIVNYGVSARRECK